MKRFLNLGKLLRSADHQHKLKKLFVRNYPSLHYLRKELKDKYGFLPIESIDLLKSIRLKWKAQKLGFEKIVIKKSKMLCYFIFDKNNNFFESLVFKNIMRDIQKFENCELREKNKLYLVFEKIGSIDQAIQNLDRFEFIDY